MIQQMLLKCDAPLFLVQFAVILAHSELNVNVGSRLVQDIALKLRLDLLIPNRFGVQVKVGRMSIPAEMWPQTGPVPGQ